MTLIVKQQLPWRSAMNTFKEGDVVKLSPSVKNHKCPEGRDDNATAVVDSLMTGTYKGGVHLDRDLHGCRYWNMDDLEHAE
jgi:hypothetical protein